MFQRLKKNFAKVALVALAMQMMVMVLPSSTHASTQVTTSLSKTDLYEGESVELQANLVTAGDYVTFFTTADGTNYAFQGSYQEGGVDDADGIENGVFVVNLDSNNFPILRTLYTIHAYETTNALDANSSLVGLVYSEQSLTTGYGYRAPEVVITPSIINQIEAADLTVTLANPGDWVTFYGTQDGTNYTFIGSEQEGGANDLDGKLDGIFTQRFVSTDFASEGNFEFHVYESSAAMTEFDSLLWLDYGKGQLAVVYDTVAPDVTMTSNPTIVNNVKAATEVTFTGNEDIKLNSSEIVFTQGTTTFKVTSSDAAFAQPLPNQIIVTIPAGTFAVGTTPIDVKAVFEDMVGNVMPAPGFIGQIAVDTITPMRVTNLVATVNSQGYVVLSWANPTTGYTGLKVTRDGAFLTTLPVGTTSFIDENVVAGTTYKYAVIAYDEAGNETATTPVPVEIVVPSAHIAAALSDSVSYQESNIQPAATSDQNEADTKGDQTENEDEGLPVWAIVLLVVLAAVGGYLIYNQKPAVTSVSPSVAPIAKKKSSPAKTAAVKPKKKASVKSTKKK